MSSSPRGLLDMCNSRQAAVDVLYTLHASSQNINTATFAALRQQPMGHQWMDILLTSGSGRIHIG